MSEIGGRSEFGGPRSPRGRFFRAGGNGRRCLPVGRWGRREPWAGMTLGAAQWVAAMTGVAWAADAPRPERGNGGKCPVAGNGVAPRRQRLRGAPRGAPDSARRACLRSLRNTILFVTLCPYVFSCSPVILPRPPFAHLSIIHTFVSHPDIAARSKLGKWSSSRNALLVASFSLLVVPLL